jgi:hypothetical protein
MFTLEHTFPDRHVIRFSVRSGKTGWEVREEHDGKVVLSISYTDWHRVERRVRQFEAEIATAAIRSAI